MRLFSLGIVFAAAACAESPLAQDMLAAHNAVRARLHIPPLTWSAEIAGQAQAWADRLLAERRFAHRPRSPYGENLFEISGALASPSQVVADWGSEAGAYDYASNKCLGVCGHYTQLVWAATKKVGCGVARNRRQEIWVCDYVPPGNFVGRRPY